MPIPVNSYAGAVAAYRRAAAKEESGETIGAEKKTNGDDGFAGLVKGAVSEAVKIAESGEKASIAALSDRADINQVVTAVAEAEVTLQTVVAVRDKVIDAYKEVLRMPM